ncbi:ADP-ribose glycohydrolase OARD1-like [Nilaparvata lugens]|uniref:ADP-ribose glycohydrolase OARD1-like n=1 Tax=Nilaparvata lugens TaxID=108931 RepID=UPI00193CB4B1|nr:ADP-ribose glycohydrolase OARD1-like [Nilaparvata lugens]
MANLEMSKEEGNVNDSRQDLFALPKSYALAHCIARNVGASRGTASVFRRKFGRFDELNLQHPTVGKALHLQDQNQNRFYLVTKDQPQEESTYQTLWQSLMHLRTHLQFLGVEQLGIPRLGCGYDGLEWKIVRPMIGRIFKDTGISGTCCVYNPWAATPADPSKPA